MNNILIKKLRIAMNTSHPIEAINEIITEYDEILKLAEWRKNILGSGKSLRKNQKEINRIASILEESGYHISFTRKDIEKDVREYFRNM